MSEKVAVLFGGDSAEREVSLKSGQAVLKGLLNRGVPAVGIDTKHYCITQLKQDGFTRAFIALHGRGGEDGVTQAILNYQGIPYTGSGVMASALAMNKLKTKQIWESLKLPTARYVVAMRNEVIDPNQVVAKLGLPLFIKPSNEGSSVGMSRVNSVAELLPALQKAFQFDEVVMIESFLAGEEYTVGIVGDNVLPSIRIKAAAEFYDYNAKYLSNETHYFCPSGLNDDQESAIRTLALEAYLAIGCEGWGRVDIMCDANNQFHLLEVNTSPGMTDHSLVPMAAKVAGIEFDELVERILSLASI